VAAVNDAVEETVINPEESTVTSVLDVLLDTDHVTVLLVAFEGVMVVVNWRVAPCVCIIQYVF